MLISGIHYCITCADLITNHEAALASSHRLVRLVDQHSEEEISTHKGGTLCHPVRAHEALPEPDVRASTSIQGAGRRPEMLR